MPLKELIKETSAYKILSAEKQNGSLSHAYLVVCSDGGALRQYLKEFAKVVMKTGDEKADERIERLIDKEIYADCSVYPKEREKILSADIDELVSDSYIKPLENKLRLFVLCGTEGINESAQNKLLKTLEEPPENVVILLGATSEYSLLPTVLSRLEKLEIPSFDKTALKRAFIAECVDEERLLKAIDISGGKASAVLKAYESGEGEELSDLCRAILSEMRSSRDIIKFVDKIDKDNISAFITAMKEEVGRLLKVAVKSGNGEASGYKIGALVAIEEMLDGKRLAINFNANTQMTVDGILFSIAEERYKWQRL